VVFGLRGGICFLSSHSCFSWAGRRLSRVLSAPVIVRPHLGLGPRFPIFLFFNYIGSALIGVFSFSSAAAKRWSVNVHGVAAVEGKPFISCVTSHGSFYDSTAFRNSSRAALYFSLFHMWDTVLADFLYCLYAPMFYLCYDHLLQSPH